MSRVIAVNDSRSITIEANGRPSTVVLKGVDIPAAEESAAAAYLHRLIDGAWVYVEEGDVYRSPDGLFINAELQRRAWRSTPAMRYLGEANPGPRRIMREPARTAPMPRAVRYRRRHR